MRPTKSIRRLYHQFGHLLVRPKLNQDQLFKALFEAGLIEPALFHDTNQDLPILYRETDQMLSIPENRFQTVIQHALVQFCKKKLGFGFNDIEAQLIQIECIKLLNLDEWRGEIRARSLSRGERQDLGLKLHGSATRILEIVGILWVDSKFREVKAQPDILIYNDNAFIRSDLLRFQERNLNEELNRSFDWLNYDNKRSDGNDQAYDYAKEEGHYD